MQACRQVCMVYYLGCLHTCNEACNIGCNVACNIITPYVILVPRVVIFSNSSLYGTAPSALRLLLKLQRAAILHAIFYQICGTCASSLRVLAHIQRSLQYWTQCRMQYLCSLCNLRFQGGHFLFFSLWDGALSSQIVSEVAESCDMACNILSNLWHMFKQP